MTHWRELVKEPIRNEADFLAFLSAVGICLWTPSKGLDFPNMEEASEFSEPTMMATWFWKDDLHNDKLLFYGKLLAGKSTFVSREFLPTLIASYGDIDPYTLHEEGRLTAPALRIYEALIESQRLPTRDLRMQAKLSAKSDTTPFQNGLDQLTALFQICKIDITGRTRGTYSYVWGLLEDWLPESLEIASQLEPLASAQAVVDHLHRQGVTLSARQWRKHFVWSPLTYEKLVFPATMHATP